MELKEIEQENQGLKDHLDGLESQINFHRNLKTALEKAKSNLLIRQSHEEIT